MVKEELYIIKNGERYALELPNPSGITLKWVSNLFSDISKLTCSYSYTFKLPMTATNRRILDMVDDIRHSSSFARISVDAEFYINGVCLCPNANLHVSEIGTSSFSCVMTWRVLKAFEKMKSDSIKLNELPSIGTFVWKTGDESLIYGLPTHDQKNTENILYPNYDAGIPYEDGVPPKPVVPIYRLVQLINDYYGVKFVLGHEVSEAMGLLPKANFNNRRYYGMCVYDDYLTYGVLPIVGIGVSRGTQSKFTVSNIEGKSPAIDWFNVGSRIYAANYIKWKVTATNQGTQDSLHDIEKTKDKDCGDWKRYSSLMFVPFGGNKYIQSTGCNTSSATTEETEITSKYQMSRGHGETVNGYHYFTHWDIYECTGELKDTFTIKKETRNPLYKLFRCVIDCTIRGEAEVRVSKEDIKNGKAEKKDYWWIYLLRVKQGEDDTDASIDTYSDETDDWMGLRSISRSETDTEYIYKFDFGVKYDVRKLSIDAADDDEVGLCFWSGSFEEGWSTKDADNKVTSTGINSTNTSTFSYLRILSITPNVQFDGLPAEMDIVENLPDISCFDFVKNLFYLNGALPRVEKDGVTISAMYYNQLRDRVVSGECLDWSKKMLSGVNDNPTSTKTYNSNFGCENYFLMAESDKGKTDEEKQEELELYGNGYGKIDIDDKRLDDEKTVFTSCFYPGLRTDLAYPSVLTGRTIKVWNGEKQIQSDVKPILGYVNYRSLDSTFEDISNTANRPLLKTYGAEFKHIRMNTLEPFDNMDTFYGYLKSILTDYVIIKEKFILNEFELQDFDESMPVYLQKYNCCFAVSTIQRDKNGVSTVELVKLPYVVPSYPTPEEMDADKTGYSYRITNNIIGFELQLERNYTSNRCPIWYELFVNNEHTAWSTEYNTLGQPLGGSYISRYVYPYEANRLKGDSYSLKFSVPQNVAYKITRTKGIDVVYTKDMSVKLRVYYDDVRCEAGVSHTLTFTKDDFGKYHVFKFIFDIYTPEGELFEQVRKKLYYFVSDKDESKITDDFGDEHENDNSVKVNDVTITGSSSLADKVAHKYTLSYTPEYADVGVKSVKVSVVGSMASSVLVSGVTIDGFTLTAQSLPSAETPLTISVAVTLTDNTTFTKTKGITIVLPTLVLRKSGFSNDLELEAVNGNGSAIYYVVVNPYGAWGSIKSISVNGESVSVTQKGENAFSLVATNINADTSVQVSVIAEYNEITMSGTFTIPVRFVNTWSVKVLDDAGLLIIDRNGKFYTSTEWRVSGNENDDADGVAVSDGTHRFIVSKKNFAFNNASAGSTLIEGQFSATDVNTALGDFGGKKNTDAVIAALSDSFAHEIRRRKDFPSGKEEYCASLGEWKIVGDKRSQINSLLSLIGGDELYYYSTDCDYLSSTRKGDNGKWFAHFGANVEYGASPSGRMQGRGFAEIPKNTAPVEDGYMSILGEDSFKAKNGSGTALFEVSYGPDGVNVSEVTMTSSNEVVVLTKVSDKQFKLSVSGVLTDETTTITVRARLNGLMRKVTKNITVVGEIVVDYDKLDNAKALILCKDYSLYTAEEWSTAGKGKGDVEGIAVSDGTHRFMVAIDDTEMCYFGGNNTIIDGLSESTSAFNGEANTATIANKVTASDGYFTSSPYSAAAVAGKYVFPNGKRGFIASYAEWKLVDDNYSLVESLIAAVGGTSLVKSFSFTYWVSTKGYNNVRAYVYHCYKSDTDGSTEHSLSSYGYRTNTALVRPFRNF